MIVPGSHLPPCFSDFHLGQRNDKPLTYWPAPSLKCSPKGEIVVALIVSNGVEGLPPMSAISKRAPRNETAAISQSNKRRLKRLLRQLFKE